MSYEVTSYTPVKPSAQAPSFSSLFHRASRIGHIRLAEMQHAILGYLPPAVWEGNSSQEQQMLLDGLHWFGHKLLHKIIDQTEHNREGSLQARSALDKWFIQQHGARFGAEGEQSEAYVEGVSPLYKHLVQETVAIIETYYKEGTYPPVDIEVRRGEDIVPRDKHTVHVPHHLLSAEETFLVVYGGNRSHMPSSANVSNLVTFDRFAGIYFAHDPENSMPLPEKRALLGRGRRDVFQTASNPSLFFDANISLQHCPRVFLGSNTGIGIGASLKAKGPTRFIPLSESDHFPPQVPTDERRIAS